MMKKRSGAHVLVESLVNEGLTTIFGIPGVDTLSVYDAFLDHSSVRAINVRPVSYTHLTLPTNREV